jgi:hypothetical protein
LTVTRLLPLQLLVILNNHDQPISRTAPILNLSHISTPTHPHTINHIISNNIIKTTTSSINTSSISNNYTNSSTTTTIIITSTNHHHHYHHNTHCRPLLHSRTTTVILLTSMITTEQDIAATPWPRSNNYDKSLIGTDLLPRRMTELVVVVVVRITVANSTEE